MSTLTAKCAYFTRLPNPLEDRGVKNYYAIVDVDTIFNLAGWREINVRDPKDSGYVPDQIRKSLLDQEERILVEQGLANLVWDIPRVLGVPNVDFSPARKVEDRVNVYDRVIVFDTAIFEGIRESCEISALCRESRHVFSFPH